MNKVRTVPAPARGRSNIVARSLQKYFTGDVSKTVLLVALLPLSVASVFGLLAAAASFFPTGYDWRRHVISELTSPQDNPQGCWLAGIGIMTAMLLLLPFAGYLARRLPVVTPRLARSAGLAFAIGFVGMILAVAVQLVEPAIGLRKLHGILATVSSLSFLVGMVCSCACGLKRRSHSSGGPRLMPASLPRFWASITLPPLVCAVFIGILKLLGRSMGIVWAQELRASFRHTILYELAFYEWIGVVLAFAYVIGTVWLLPDSSGARRGAAPAGAPAPVSRFRSRAGQSGVS